MTRYSTLTAVAALALATGLVAAIAPASAADYRGYNPPRPQVEHYLAPSYGPSPAELWFLRHRHHRHQDMLERRFDEPRMYNQYPPPPPPRNFYRPGGYGY